MDQRSSSTFPLRNFVLFLVLSFLILFGHSWIVGKLRQQQPQVAEVQKKEQPAKPEVKEAKKVPDAKPSAEKPDVAKPAEKETPKVQPSDQPPVDRQWVTLGSVDPDDPYRMLVTLDNRGAALARIELSSPRYRDLEDRTGYLGHIIMEDDGKGDGCPVQVVGEGTPAAKAGLKQGDRIVAVAGEKVGDADAYEAAMGSTKAGQKIELTVRRDGKEVPLTVALIRRPLEIVRPELKKPEQFVPGERPTSPIHPEKNDPLSFLATLQQLGDEKLPEDTVDDLNLEAELKGVAMRGANWKVESDQDHAVFRLALPKQGVEIVKTYRLAKVPVEAVAENEWQPHRSYHLEFDIEVRNVGDAKRKIAYRLDGANGLPHEGAWYAGKVSFNWGAAGLRDVVIGRAHRNVEMATCTEIADKKLLLLKGDQPIAFVGGDAQYFSAIMIPDATTSPEIGEATALRVGEVEANRKTTTNTTVRLVTTAQEVAPGASLAHHYTLFVGPKKPALLEQYELGDLITFGWFPWVGRPMTQILHFFYWIVRNYGLAIIMLTVLVRGCMFPLSRKQALNAQKMQELQPEIKRLQEKYKKDVEGRTKAQQELFRKHNYNPLSGCLVLFVQLPIFIGLYRSLQVDVELRDAPLLSHAIRWCSNLAAPDMMFDWHRFMPDFINSGVGIFGLGPYFNLLPILTICLFIWQQKMFMPPPTDEQSAMQQKIMQYMMIFMGLMFYKVAAGLCIYFIASSLWGLAERKFLPKAVAHSAPVEGRERSTNRENNQSRKKNRGKR